MNLNFCLFQLWTYFLNCSLHVDITYETDIPLQTTYVTKYIEKCPEEGYFFKRDLQGTNAGACYLCFCKENGTAVCWQRNNKRCDAESYQHNWVKRRASRSRRSPISFGDIFLGEATRDVLNTNGKKTCKAGEASYSEGCPPDDWCVGCTVCDCNINGKWDCHLLSFCTEEAKKKNKKGEKGELKGHFYDPFDVPKTRRSERKVAQKAVQNLPEKMAQDRQKKKIGKSNTRRYFFKNGTLVNKTIFDIRKRKKSASILNQSSMEIQRWSDLNMKIRKIPDQITRQILIDKQQKNAKKVSEAANFFVRKMPNKKSKQIIDQKRAQAVNVLAKRQPNKKKKRQVLLPSGVKVPKELLDKLPPGMIHPTRSPPGDHFPKKSHVKRVLPNQMAATKPSRQLLPEKKQVERSLGLSPEVPDKKIVKRSAKYNDTSNDKQKRKGKSPVPRKRVPAAKSTNKGGKTPKKKRENAKIQMKSNLKHNKNQQKYNNRKNNKKIPKNKGKNNTLNNNQHSKSKNSVKNSTNNKKNIKLKNNIRKNNNNQKHKITKQIRNGNSNKSVKHNVDVNNMKKHAKHNHNNKKPKPSVNNKSVVNKKPINKPLKENSNKNSPKISNTREKRSNAGPWVKTVIEDKKVTKFAPKVNKSSTKPGINVTKTIRKNTPTAGSLQLNRRMINEEVKKLTGNIQANLNRKVLEVVEQMLGQKLDTKSKKVKRSVQLEPELIHENMSFEVVNDSEIDLSMTPNAYNSKQFYRKPIKQTVHRRDIGEEKEGLSLPFIEFFGQKVKRSANEDGGYNESRHIPFIVKKRPLPPVKHIEKRAVDFHLLQTPASKPPNVSLHKVYQEMDKYLKYPTLTTQDYLTTDIKRSVPLSKVEGKDDGDLIDIHIPIKKLARNIMSFDTENTAYTFTKDNSLNRENVSKLQISATTQESESKTPSISKKEKRSVPLMKKIVMQKSKRDEKHLRSNFNKKLQKVSVDKINKVKVNRHKRSASIKVSGNPNLQKFGNEISTHSLQDTKNTENKFDTTDSILKYYKYAIDDVLDTNSKPVDKNYVTEFVEVYTKNVAAKRSVGQHIEPSPDFDILQMSHVDFNNDTVPVNSSNENDDEFTAINSNIKENKTTAHDDNKLKVHAAELLPFNPTNVLDDKVVIIQDQNVSSINSLSELITDSQTRLPVANDSEINLFNKTVIGIKNHKNIFREDIEKSVTMVDQSVVVINDQMSAIMPTTDSHLSLTTEYNLESKLDSNMYMLVDKNNDSLLMTTTAKYKLSNNKEENLVYVRKTLPRPITNTSLKLDDGNNTSISITENHFNETKVKKVNNDDIIIVRENDFEPQKSFNQLENNNKYLLKLASENYILSEYKVENKVTKQNISVMENRIEVSEDTPAKANITTIKIENNVSTLKPLVKNYLKYDVDTKSYTLKPNSSKPKKDKKLKIAMIQKDETNNSTEKAEPKHWIDDYVVIVKQKDLYTKMKDKSTTLYNTTFSVEKDLKMKSNTTLTTKDSNSTKADDWFETTTLKIVEQNYTTQFRNNVYSTEVLQLFENQQSTNQTNPITLKVVKPYDVKKIGFKKAGKHKLKKILTTLYNKTNTDERYYNRGEKYFNKEDKYFVAENKEAKYFMKEIVKTQKTMNKTKDLKGFFKKLLSGFKFNKHTRKPSNIKRFKILKYLQKFFKKIFSDGGKHKKNKTIAHELNRRRIIETLCSSFGPCNINIKNKAKLQSQIDHLNSETYKMLRSVKIIKGLLKLVDMSKNDKNLNNKTSTKTNFKNDVQKLHAILRDTYSNAEQMDKLTETQKIQIQYIKNSTQNFIQSAAKFTMVLNEIINIITVPDHKKNKDVHYKTTVERKEQPDIKHFLKSRNTNKTVAVTETNESLKKLKELISKYSLIQNTFMQKIFTVLTRLDGKENMQKKNKVNNSTATTNTIAQNKTEEIQVYTKNIIQNLRKLKNLAQNLNGDMGQVRRKRDLRNDDSLEYMLMLMEYLLKQQHPLDSTPVNDGIDLLIEAIKSAPNIKAIKKKVLPIYRPNQITFREQNLTKHTSDSSEVNQSKETSSDSDSKPSKELNVTFSHLEEPKFNAIDQSMDDESEDQDYYMFNKRAHAPTTAAITTSTKSHTNVYWHKQVTTDAYYTIPDVKEVTKPKTKSTKHEYGDKITKFDFYDKFLDDETSTSTTSTTPEFEYMTIVTTDTPEMTTKTEMTTKSIDDTPLIQILKYHQGEDDISASKSRIDWLEETYEEEIKAETQKKSSTTSKPFTLNKKRKQIKKFNVTKEPKKSVSVIDISGLSKETVIEVEGSNKSTAAKEILYKKEMGLLNSLDYGTKKTELDVSASKESGTIDKYAGDAFATYSREDKF